MEYPISDIIKKLNHIHEYVHFIKDEFYSDSMYKGYACKEIHMPEYGILFEGSEDIFINTEIKSVSRKYEDKIVIELTYDKVSDRFDILIRKFYCYE